MSVTDYRDLIEDAEASVEYWVDVPVTDFTRDLIRLMGDKITRAELARRIDSSRQYITKLLGGNANFTLATMTKLAMAVGGVVRVHIAPQEATTMWIDRFEPLEMSSFATDAEARPAQSEKLRSGAQTLGVSTQARESYPTQADFFANTQPRNRAPLAA